MAATMKGKLMTEKRKMYDGTNRKARTLAANRRRKQIDKYYTYATIAITSGLGGIWVGIVLANW